MQEQKHWFFLTATLNTITLTICCAYCLHVSNKADLAYRAVQEVRSTSHVPAIREPHSMTLEEIQQNNLGVGLSRSVNTKAMGTWTNITVGKKE